MGTHFLYLTSPMCPEIPKARVHTRRRTVVHLPYWARKKKKAPRCPLPHTQNVRPHAYAKHTHAYTPEIGNRHPCANQRPFPQGFLLPAHIDLLCYHTSRSHLRPLTASSEPSTYGVGRCCYGEAATYIAEVSHRGRERGTSDS